MSYNRVKQDSTKRKGTLKHNETFFFCFNIFLKLSLTLNMSKRDFVRFSSSKCSLISSYVKKPLHLLFHLVLPSMQVGRIHLGGG